MGSRTAILCLGLCVLGLSASAVQADAIHVTWEESPPPVEDLYFVPSCLGASVPFLISVHLWLSPIPSYRVE